MRKNFSDLQEQDIFLKKGLYKTELCSNFLKTGVCRYGDKCQFAHGESELRFVAKNSKYKTKKCIQYSSTGVCKYGARCLFVHEACEKDVVQELHRRTRANTVPAASDEGRAYSRSREASISRRLFGQVKFGKIKFPSFIGGCNPKVKVGNNSIFDYEVRLEVRLGLPEETLIENEEDRVEHPEKQSDEGQVRNRFKSAGYKGHSDIGRQDISVHVERHGDIYEKENDPSQADVSVTKQKGAKRRGSRLRLLSYDFSNIHKSLLGQKE